TVEADCGAGAYEPARLVVTCGQGTVVATEIHWSGWSAATATGTSVVMVDACVPRCAAVSARPYPARLVLTTPVDTAQGPRFSRLAIDWTGPEPYGRASDSYSLPTSAGPG
ncbi:MAG: hypothetical protein ACREQ5_41360, partial [Candidatus Dormibacteria bacterium]